MGVQAILAAPGLSFGQGTLLENSAGISLNVDMDAFRVEGVVNMGFIEGGTFNVGVGGRVFLVVHRGDKVDLSVGGGAALIHGSFVFGGSATRVQLEGGAQIRYFMTSSVALTATAGLGLSFGDGGVAFGIGGQQMGTFGLVYYF